MSTARSIQFLAIALIFPAIGYSQQSQTLRKEWADFQMVFCRSEAIDFNGTSAIKLSVRGSTDGGSRVSFTATFDSTGTPLSLKNTDGLSLYPGEEPQPNLEVRFGANVEMITYNPGQPAGAPVALSDEERARASAIMAHIWGRRCGRGRSR